MNQEKKELAEYLIDDLIDHIILPYCGESYEEEQLRLKKERDEYTNNWKAQGIRYWEQATGLTYHPTTFRGCY
jgi:hypothetical protein